MCLVDSPTALAEEGKRIYSKKSELVAEWRGAQRWSEGGQGPLRARSARSWGTSGHPFGELVPEEEKGSEVV